MAGEQILVIDDSPTIIKMVQLVLARAGYRIEVAADGEAGLEAARRRRPDLVLLDFMMPRMNGYQVCLELAADPELSQVPVVLMSAKGAQVGGRFVKMMGIVDYVTKPFTPDGLSDVVHRALAGARPSAMPQGTLDEGLEGDEPTATGAIRAPGLARLRDELAERIADRLQSRERSLAAGSLPAMSLPPELAALPGDAVLAFSTSSPATMASADLAVSPAGAAVGFSLAMPIIERGASASGSSPAMPIIERGASASGSSPAMPIIERGASASGSSPAMPIIERGASAAGSSPAMPIAERGASAAGSSPAMPIAERAGLLDELRACLDDATLLRLLAEAAAVGEADDLRGDLRVIPLTEILQLIAAHELSGPLQLERRDGRQGRTERIEVHLRRGRVEQALAHGLPEELRLGRFVLDRELMEPARFEALLAALPRGQLLGRLLVERGHLTEAELRAVLARQSSELIYEALRWRTGTFRFRADLELPTAALEASLSLSMDALIHDGCRRVDEWHLIERVIDSAQAVFARDDGGVQRGRSRLSREEQLVFDLLDGQSRVADLVRTSKLGSFEVSRALYRLLSIKLARRAE